MSTLALCSPAAPAGPQPSRRTFLATIAAVPLVGPLAAFPQPGCWGANGPQPPQPPTAPSPSPAWDSWDEVAYILARFQFAAVGDYHSLYRIGFAPSVAIWGGTGPWQHVAADLADARDEAGERLLGQGVRCGGRAWAVVVWDATLAGYLAGDGGGAS